MTVTCFPLFWDGYSQFSLLIKQKSEFGVFKLESKLLAPREPPQNAMQADTKQQEKFLTFY